MSERHLEPGDNLEILQRIPLFRDISRKRLERIAMGAHRSRAVRGETVFHKGDYADGFYYLIQGRIKLVIFSPQGDEKVIEIIREGMTFGEAVMFINQPFPADAQAMVESHLLFIPRDPVIDDLRTDPELGIAMLANLSRRLHGIVHDLETISLCSSAQRAIGYLLVEAERIGCSGAECELQLPAAKGVIASLLNVTPETLSRIFAELSGAGLITVTGRTITLHDLKRLREYHA